jgi:hypothetical protein
MTSAVPSTLPCIILSSSRLDAPAARGSLSLSAYNLEKYRWGFPGGGLGPP